MFDCSEFGCSTDESPPLELLEYGFRGKLHRKNPLLGPVGLSKPQISTAVSSRENLEDRQDGRYLLQTDGSMLEIRLPDSARGAERPGGERGPITRFTDRSRRNLMRQFARIRRDPGARHWSWATLTFPGRWDGCFATAKNCLNTFAQRFHRTFPLGAFVWKMDIEDRKSGASEGKDIPHFHLAIYCPHVSAETLRIWMDRNWPEITLQSELADELALTEQEKTDHRSAAVRCESMRSFRGVMSYASGYMSHEVTIERSEEPEGPRGAATAAGPAGHGMQELYPHIGLTVRVQSSKTARPGKFWGIRWRKNIPWAGTKKGLITREQARWLLRVVKRACGYDHRPKSATYFTHGASWAQRWASRLTSSDPPTHSSGGGIAELERRATVRLLRRPMFYN